MEWTCFVLGWMLTYCEFIRELLQGRAHCKYSEALQELLLPTVQVRCELKIASATDVWIITAKPKTLAEDFAVNTDSDQEEKEVLIDALPRNGVCSPTSLLQGGGSDAGTFWGSVFLCFILLTVEKTPHLLFFFFLSSFFFPLFFFFYFHFSHLVVMRLPREEKWATVVFHSFLVYTFVHKKPFFFFLMKNQ